MLSAVSMAGWMYVLWAACARDAYVRRSPYAPCEWSASACHVLSMMGNVSGASV